MHRYTKEHTMIIWTVSILLIISGEMYMQEENVYVSWREKNKRLTWGFKGLSKLIDRCANTLLDWIPTMSNHRVRRTIKRADKSSLKSEAGIMAMAVMIALVSSKKKESNKNTAKFNSDTATVSVDNCCIVCISEKGNTSWASSSQEEKLLAIKAVVTGTIL
jgi:hypothetical protein